MICTLCSSRTVAACDAEKRKYYRNISPCLHVPITNPGYTVIVARANHRNGRQDLPLSFLYILTRSDASAPGCFFSPIFPARGSPAWNAQGICAVRKNANITEMFHLMFTYPSRTTVILSLFQERTTGTEDKIFLHPSFICNPERCQRSGFFLSRPQIPSTGMHRVICVVQKKTQILRKCFTLCSHTRHERRLYCHCSKREPQDGRQDLPSSFLYM